MLRRFVPLHYEAVPPSLSLQTSSARKTAGTPSAAARLKLTKGNLEKLGGGTTPAASSKAVPQGPVSSGGLSAAAPRAIPAQARAVPAAARAAGRSARGAAAPAAKVGGERRAKALVMGAVFAFMVTGATVWAMNYQGAVAEGKSIAQLEASLKVVHNQQANFRVINQRFATWPELEAAGARLGPTQKVLRSNASSSHWYMSIFDRETGAVCDQTGELFDEEPGERKSSCRTRSS